MLDKVVGSNTIDDAPDCVLQLDVPAAPRSRVCWRLYMMVGSSPYMIGLVQDDSSSDERIEFRLTRRTPFLDRRLYLK